MNDRKTISDPLPYTFKMDSSVDGVSVHIRHQTYRHGGVEIMKIIRTTFPLAPESFRHRTLAVFIYRNVF